MATRGRSHFESPDLDDMESHSDEISSSSESGKSPSPEFGQLPSLARDTPRLRKMNCISAPDSRKRKSDVLDDSKQETPKAPDEPAQMRQNPNEVSGYNTATEIMPRRPIYHPSFKEAQDSVGHIFDTLKETLDNSEYTDKNIKGLEEALKSSRGPRVPEEVRVGLIGDMATGKSSLLNSIMGQGVLARKGDSGQSCTWVVQEFGKPLPGQTSAYRAEVLYYDRLERRDILAEMFREAFASVQTDEEQDKDSINEGSLYENKQLSQSSIQALHCLLCGVPDFRTETQTAAYVKSAKCEDVLKYLEQIADTVLGEEAKNSNVAILEASTPSGLLTQLRKYTANSSDEIGDEDGPHIPSHWPLIKRIRYGLTSRVLEEGVTLVDLPGLKDINRVRNRAVFKAMSACNHYLVIANIKRAQSDDTLFQYLHQGHRKFGSDRSIAVCTHTDMIDDVDSILNASPSDQKTFLTLREQRSKMAARKKKVGSKMVHITDMSPDEMFATLNELREANSAAHKAEVADEEFRIVLRNERVSKSLRKKYQADTGDGKPLPVFCVSNKAYETYHIGYTKGDGPLLSLEATQIPKLREYLFVATADGRFNEMLFLANHKLPSVLASFRLWCAKTHMVRKQEILEYITKPMSKVDEILNIAFLQIQAVMDDKISSKMTDREADWTEQAAALCEAWADNFKTGAYLNMCRNKGLRKGTKAKPEISWNKELSQIIQSDLKAGFEEVLAQCSEFERLLKDELIGLLEEIKDSIRRDEQASLMALGLFVRFIDTQKPILLDVIKRGFTILRRSMRKLQRVTITDDEDSSISDYMAEAYGQVSAINGGKCGVRRLAKMDALVSSGQLWREVQSTTEEAKVKLLLKRRDGLELHIDVVFKEILANFDNCCQDKAVEDEKEVALRMNLNKSVEAARVHLDTTLKERIEECKTWA